MRSKELAVDNTIPHTCYILNKGESALEEG